MVRACGSCGAENAEDARFCAQCGTSLNAGAAGPREARKVVSALFADVVGSTALGERLDPEDFTEIVGTAVGRMAGAVEEFGGEVSELAGDGLLALFGAPVAHEDDPERAVLAGLRIVELMAEYGGQVAREWDIEGFAVRVGIETGLAILGPVGGGGKVEYGAMGDSLNTAARLQAAAEAGTVLVGAQTQRLIEPLFEWGEARELTLKGKADSVLAYPARRLRAEPGAVRGLEGREVAVVGRDRELEVGGEAIEGVLAGSGAVLLVSGDAGIGKTRLVSELRARFERSESAGGTPRWLEGRCVSYGESLPYWPFRALLRDWLAGAASEADLAPGDALEAEANGLFGDRAEEFVPLLGAVLGLTGEEELAASAAEPAELRQRRIQDAVGTLLERLAADGPVVVALDDLHWADGSSVALVERLLSVSEAAAVLLVLTARPERDTAFWRTREAALRELPHRTREIALEALPREADGDLLGALVGSAELPSELRRRLLARAEGNPFYLEELVRSLIDAGALVRANGDWRFDREVPVETPETVEKVILSRIDRLGEAAHDVLAAAAVLGRQFPVELVEVVCGAPEGAAEALRELERADLVREGARWPTPLYRFKHTLIQEAAYRSLLKRRRQELHRAAAEAIERLYGERLDEFLGMLALHWSGAGEDRRALEYHRRAGDAARGYAGVEALEHYTAALDAAARLGIAPADASLAAIRRDRGGLLYDFGDDPEGARTELELAIEGADAGGDAALKVEVLIALAGVWRASDFARAVEVMHEAAQLADTAGDPASQVNALARLSIMYSNQLKLDRALAFGERALALALEQGEERRGSGPRPAPLRAYALDALKLVAWQTGDLAALEDLSDRLMAMLEHTEPRWMLPWVMLESSFVALGAGRCDDAIRRIDEAIEVGRGAWGRMHEPLMVDAKCWTYRSRGDYERALASGRRASELAHEVQQREWAAWADATLGWTLLDAHAPDEAAACLERGLRTAEQGNAPAQVVRCVSLLAWARSMREDRDGASEALERAERMLDEVTVPPQRAWLFGAHAYVAVARAHLTLGDPERAERLLDPVVAAAEQSGWQEPIACGTLVIGQSRAARGDATAADSSLRRALAVAEATGLPAPEWEAHVALAELGADDAGDHLARAKEIVEQLAEPLSDPKLRAGLLAAAPRS